jgi:hypothetical protein
MINDNQIQNRIKATSKNLLCFVIAEFVEDKANRSGVLSEAEVEHSQRYVTEI